MKKIGIFAGILLLSSCAHNQAFLKKSGQTNDQYRNDMLYCKGEATGAWNNRNGVSKMNIYKGEMGAISYEDCMRQLGYEQAN